MNRIAYVKKQDLFPVFNIITHDRAHPNNIRRYRCCYQQELLAIPAFHFLFLNHKLSRISPFLKIINGDDLETVSNVSTFSLPKEMNDKFTAFVDIFTILGASTTVCIFGVPRRIDGDAAGFQGRLVSAETKASSELSRPYSKASCGNNRHQIALS